MQMNMNIVKFHSQRKFENYFIFLISEDKVIWHTDCKQTFYSSFKNIFVNSYQCPALCLMFLIYNVHHCNGNRTVDTEHVYSKVIYHNFSLNNDVLMNYFVRNLSTRIRSDMVGVWQVYISGLLSENVTKYKLKGNRIQ